MLIDLPKFLAYEAHKYLFYGYIRAFRTNFPDVTVEKAIQNFWKYHIAFNEVLSDENFNLESARTLFYKLDKQFLDLLKESKIE